MDAFVDSVIDISFLKMVNEWTEDILHYLPYYSSQV